MRGRVCWEKKVKCSDGVISVHITEDTIRKIEGIEGELHFRIPSRIGIDFHDFKEGSHDYIPNVSLSDLIQLINYLHLLSNSNFRRKLITGVFPHRFGIEFDFRRKLDLDVKSVGEGREIIEMYYEDPQRFERFLAGWIEPWRISTLILALKECVVEYSYLTNKALLL